MRAILRFLGVSMLMATGCAPPPAARTTPAPTSVRPAPVESSTLQDRGWGVVRSPALGLKLALPEAKSWLPVAGRPATSASAELRHEPTSTSLVIRRWRASRLPRVEACEAELRARSADLAVVDETNLVSQREVRVPRGFVTRITLMALPGTSTRVAGQALAVGAGVGECLALVARTECSGEAELAERLRLLDVALAHVRVTEVEERVPSPEPLPH